VDAESGFLPNRHISQAHAQALSLEAKIFPLKILHVITRVSRTSTQIFHALSAVLPYAKPAILRVSSLLSRFCLQPLIPRRFWPGSPAILMIPEDRGGRGISAFVAVLPCLIALGASAQNAIDPEKSVMTVHVFKAGLFSAFGHEHEVRAPIQQGSFNEANPSVELTVDARKLRVVDKEISEKDRAQVQQDMLGPKVLDSEKFAEIRFHSTAVDSQGEGKWLVTGDLTLHGQTRPVKVHVERQNGRYKGTAELKQKDFGITPIVVGGGAVKVKNELRVDFDIVAVGAR
jgi:polyisoprenoid-binding protein YceI